MKPKSPERMVNEARLMLSHILTAFKYREVYKKIGLSKSFLAELYVGKKTCGHDTYQRIKSFYNENLKFMLEKVDFDKSKKIKRNVTLCKATTTKIRRFFSLYKGDRKCDKESIYDIAVNLFIDNILKQENLKEFSVCFKEEAL